MVTPERSDTIFLQPCIEKLTDINKYLSTIIYIMITLHLQFQNKFAGLVQVLKDGNVSFHII
jgi:hypothetical protein